jgi:hypothetical protein
MVDAFSCMCDWIMVASEKVLPNTLLITKIISSIETCLDVHNLSKTKGQDIDSIKVMAQFVLSHMLNFIGNFPPTDDISTQSSSLIMENDEVYDGESNDISEYCRHYMFDDLFIFTVIEQPNEKDGPGVTLIVRDLTGKFSWDTKMLFGPIQKSGVVVPKVGKYTGSSSKGLTGHTVEDPTNTLIMKFSTKLEIKEREGLKTIMDLIDQEVIDEKKSYNEESEYFKNLDISAKPPVLTNKYLSDCKFQMSRLLLSHLGFFSFGLNNKKRFYQLQSNQKLIRNLKYLDGTTERESHKFAVVFIAEGQDLQNEILKSESSSDRFEKFVHTLGWNVNLFEHTGFKGGLDGRKTLSTGTYTPFYADYKQELIFHCPSMMPTNLKDEQQLHKKRHVGNDHVKIIWSESTRDYGRETITSQFNLFQIVVYPLTNGLLRVQILKKDDKINTGPLQDGMIISEHCLGQLCRLTCVNANKITRSLTTGYQRPYEKRASTISDIASKSRSDLDVSEYFSNLFLSKLENNKLLENSSKNKGTKKTVTKKTDDKTEDTEDKKTVVKKQEVKKNNPTVVKKNVSKIN